MIGVDTHVLIWGLKKQATPNRVQMISRAEQLIADATAAKDRILIPSLVLSELLVQYAPEARVAMLSEIQRSFFIADFDFRAAAIAAKLYADKESRNASRDAAGSTTQCIKVDISILATAEAHRPKVFYVEDGPMAELAKRMAHHLTIRVEPLPKLRPKQQNLGDAFS